MQSSSVEIGGGSAHGGVGSGSAVNSNSHVSSRKRGTGGDKSEGGKLHFLSSWPGLGLGTFK